MTSPGNLKAHLHGLLRTSAPYGIRDWLSSARPGDWLLWLACAGLVVSSFPLLWRDGRAERAVIRQDGQTVAELALHTPRTYAVQGPLGITTVEIAPGRARVQSDPGPRQYCVQQGWLTRPGATALCAPNRVSLQLTGDHASHDTLSY